MRLDHYSPVDFSRGRPAWNEALWLLVQAVLVSSWLPGSAHRVWLLRRFGARIGQGVRIKPGVRVKFPWRLSVGDHAWIGEDVWVDNLAQVSIGSHVCLSQAVYLCTGSHDWSRENFDLQVKPIVVGAHAWLAAKSVVAPGVRVGEGAILALGSVAVRDLLPWQVHQGNPAQSVKQRVMQDAESMPGSLLTANQRPEKIVFLNRFFYPDHSATSQLLSDLAFDLASAGIVVEVITSRLRYDDPTALLPAQELVDGVRVHRVWTSRFGRGSLPGRVVDYLSFYLSAAWRLFWTLQRGGTVVAKTDPPMLSVLASVVARLRGARLVNWLQDLFPEVAGALAVRGMQGRAQGVLRALRNASLRSACTNVVLGERMARHLLEQGVPPERIRIIHNWSDGVQIQPLATSDNPLRQEWDLQGKFVLGYSGNMGRAHEFATLLEAAESLRDAPDVVFLFIGGGQQKAWVQAEAQRRGMNNILFRPYQPREMLAQSLSLPDVHLITLQPALEGLIVPSKFYGILAAGRPVLFVGDPAGEIAMLVKQLQCGYAISVGDASVLAERIRQLRADALLREGMGARGRDAYMARYDKPVALAAWRSVLYGQGAEQVFTPIEQDHSVIATENTK